MDEITEKTVQGDSNEVAEKNASVNVSDATEISAQSKIAATFDKTSAIDPLLGKVIGDRYLVEELIGSGGWGRVYRVLHQGLNKHLALKLLHSSHIYDREKIARFKQEAEAISNLDHPNICRVVDFAEGPEGQPCMVMELLVGRNLDEAIKAKTKLPLTDVVNVGVQLCAALSAAHAKGIVHRDLKPSNLMLSEVAPGQSENVGDLSESTASTSADAKVKVLDFGLAKIMDAQSAGAMSLTDTGLMLGTPAYMSPEQCLGQQVDARADIYAIGCILYEAFTGTKAFGGDSVLQIMNAHLKDNPKTFAKQNASESERGLQAILMKAMERDRDSRYQTVDELLADLTKLQQQQKVVVSRKKLRKPLTLKAVAKLALAAVVAVSIAITGLVGYLIYEGNDFSVHRIESIDGKNLAALNKQVESDPNNPDFYVQRGALHLARDERDSAIEDFGTALRLDPNNLKALERRAEMYVMTHEYPKALADVNKAVALSPRWNTAWAERSRVYALMRRYDLAISNAKHAIAIDRWSYTAWMSMASAYEALGQFDYALDCLKQQAALSTKPDGDDIYWDNWAAGLTYLHANDPDNAASHFRTALGAHNKMAQAHADLAAALAMKGDWSGAEDEIKKTMSLDSFPARSYRLKGEMYRVGGKWSQAVQEYSTSTSLEPWYGPGFEQRALAEVAQGNMTSALADLQRAKKTLPYGASVYSNLALVEDQLGKTADAQADINKAFALTPNLPDNFLRRAQIAMHHGDYRRAFIDLNQSIAANPRFAEAYATRAVALAKVGANNAANDDSEIARKLFYHRADVPLKLSAPREQLADAVTSLAHPSLTLSAKSVDIPIADLTSDQKFAMGCAAIWTNLLANTTDDSENELEIWTINPDYQDRIFGYLSMWDAQDRAGFEKAVAELAQPTGDKKLAAFNHVRAIALCRMAYMVGWINEVEAWKLINPIAQSIRKQFSSWEDLGSNYGAERKIELPDNDPKEFEDALRDYLTNPKRAPHTVPFK